MKRIPGVFQHWLWVLPLLLAPSTLLQCVAAEPAQSADRSWAADNGNGTYSNPLSTPSFSTPTLSGSATSIADRHDHAYHASSADSAFARLGQLAHRRLRFRSPGPRSGLSSRGWKGDLRSGYLGSEFPVPQRKRFTFSPSGIIDTVTGEWWGSMQDQNAATPWAA